MSAHTEGPDFDRLAEAREILHEAALDRDEIEQLHGQIFDLKALLGLFCAFMESDIEAGKISEKSLRRHYLAEARQWVPRPKSG
jgi:hypothetical protein